MAKALATKQESFFGKNKLLIAILGVVFLVFANTLSNDYCMDDEIVTIHHPLTSKGIAAIPEILKSPYFKADIYSYEYRPVVHISFAIEHQFLGESASMSHFVNLLLYLLLVMVTFNLLKQLFPKVNELILAIITLLFALHPTHTEVVASIKNRDEILALLFTFLAFQQAIKFCLTAQWWRILTALLLFNVAMGSKVTVLPFALMIPLSISVLLKPYQPFKLLLLAVLMPLTASLWIETFSLKQQLTLVFGSVFTIAFINVKSWKAIVNRFKYLLNANSIEMEASSGVKVDYFISNFKDLLKLFNGNVLVLIVLLLLNVSIWFFPWSPTTLVIPMIVVGFFSLFAKSQSKLALLLFFLSFYCFQILFLFSELSGIVIFYGVFIAGVAGILRIIRPVFFLYLVFPFLYHQNFVPVIVLICWTASYFFIDGTSKALLRKVILTSHFSLIAVSVLLYFLLKDFPIGDTFILSLFVNTLVLFTSQIASKISPRLFVAIIALIFAALSFVEFRNSSIYNDFLSRKTQEYLQTAAAKAPAPKIVPTASYRPVLFAEFPIAEFPQPLDKKLSLAAVALLKYLKLTLVPYPLAFYYGYREVEALPLVSFPVIFSFLLHLALVAAVIYFYKRNLLIAFGIGFYLIVISPFSTLFYPIPGVIADRYLFAPTLGFAIALIGFLAMVFRVDVYAKQLSFSAFAPAFKYILSAFLICYAFISIGRNTDWKDRLTLFRSDIQHVDNSAQAHNLLAFHLTMEAQKKATIQERNEMLEEAVFHFRRATEIWPEFMNATYDLGRVLEQLGRWREAINAYHRTFEIDTTFSDAIFRAGIVYENLSQLDSAIICYEFVANDNPQNAAAFNNLSFAHFKQKNYHKAIEVCKAAFKANPQNTDPLVNIGKTFVNMSQTDSAIYYFEMAYSMRPGDAGLVQMLYQLYSEKKTDSAKAELYLRELQKMRMVR